MTHNYALCFMSFKIYNSLKKEKSQINLYFELKKLLFSDHKLLTLNKETKRGKKKNSHDNRKIR